MDNVYDWEDPKNRSNIGFPDIFRCLIVGESNSGKTCLLFKLLLENLDYNNLIMVGNTLAQPKYKILKKAFDCGLSIVQTRTLFLERNKIKTDILNTCKKEKMELDINDFLELHCKKNNLEPSITVEYFKPNQLIPRPESLDKNLNNIVIFDDCMNSRNQEAMKDYFTLSRHENICVFYLSQNYFALDRRSIRSNTNVLILFRIGNNDLSILHKDKCAFDFDLLDEFKELCYKVWNKKYGYLLIDFDSTPESGKRYRQGLDTCYIPLKFRHK